MSLYATGTAVPLKPSCRTSNSDCEWAAGLFEGEGTVTLATNRIASYTRARVLLSSTDQEIVNFFHTRWPGSCRNYMPQSRTGRAKRAWSWTVSCRKAITFLQDIRPYIRTSRVRAKIDLVFEAQAHRHQGPSPDQAAYRRLHDGYRARMTGLNRRGVA